MKVCLISFLIIFLFSATSVFAWDDICQEAKETPYMTSVKLNDFYKDTLHGHIFSGHGIVRNVRSYEYQYVVVVDCGNDVLINVVTSSDSVKELRAGQSVSFDGKCNHGFRRAYRDTQQTYQVYELIDGDVR